MPNIRIKNTFPNIISKNDTPHIKILSGGSASGSGGMTTTFNGIGYPIGLLMSITDIKSHSINNTTPATVSNFKPNIRIRND